MGLFMRGDVGKSLKDFDDGLEEYFATSRKYRSSLRRGSIVLVDGDDSMFKFLMFLTERCGLEVGIIHISDVSNARKAVTDIGSFNVKAVLIDSGMIGESMDASFTSWLGSECPRVPVWAVNCETSVRQWILSQSIKVGIIEKAASLASIAEAVGFPKECHKFVEEFAI